MIIPMSILGIGIVSFYINSFITWFAGCVTITFLLLVDFFYWLIRCDQVFPNVSITPGISFSNRSSVAELYQGWLSGTWTASFLDFYLWGWVSEMWNKESKWDHILLLFFFFGLCLYKYFLDLSIIMNGLQSC